MLADKIRIARRFQRSIRIDADLGSPTALEGFVLAPSLANALRVMANHVAEGSHGAFTWTGPFGSGKSSLAVAFSALLTGNQSRRNRAAKLFGDDLAETLWKSLPPSAEGWRVIPIVGRRDDPARVLGGGLEQAGLSARPTQGWTGQAVLEQLAAVAHSAQEHRFGGVVVLVDEMGKLLEYAASEDGDVHVFQDLAELANRSSGRLIFIGVLHQAFEEYAHRLSRQYRDEWSKIQGRFVDLHINPQGEEQVELISRAIENADFNPTPSDSCLLVAKLLRRGRGGPEQELAKKLAVCWPLHPVVAGLLGPISRRRFGQNQRSIFGFLNSSEPFGFQEFIQSSPLNAVYSPALLWDYLRANLEPSILASPDGHRWAMTVEALERCESLGVDDLHLQLLKVIGLIDLLKERSGMAPSIPLLQSCFPEIVPGRLKDALDQLVSWSFVIFRKFIDAYGIFAGSDFDIDQAIGTALQEVETVDVAMLKAQAGLQPLLAKRHYHETGALRWFDMDIAPAIGLATAFTNVQLPAGTAGKFVLVLPTEGESLEQLVRESKEAVGVARVWDLVLGVSHRASFLVDSARELLALTKVSRERSELAGDSVARRELSARIAAIQTQLETELRKAVDSAQWISPDTTIPRSLRQAELNTLASDLADNRYFQAPRIHNELLNRHKPSSNAIAAQNELLRRMVLFEGKKRLGIDGFPAEGGLFASVLESTRLYRNVDGEWRFVPPPERGEHRLRPMWTAAKEHLQANADRTVPMSEIYDIWRKPPFGLKDGLMPIFAVCFYLSQRSTAAVYREGIFRSKFDDVDVQYLYKDPSSIQLRWLDLSDASRRLLSGLADTVRRIDQTSALLHLQPVDVARAIVGIYEGLPSWAKRTTRLSSNAIAVRDLLKRARDPNQFLFSEIPAALGATPLSVVSLDQVLERFADGIDELTNAFPQMLSRLRELALTELGVPNGSAGALAELRARAENLQHVAGDFQLDAFCTRLARFDGNPSQFEGVASLAVSKPPRDWVDPDLDQAALNLAELAQRFIRAETFARVKGRPQKRHALAIMVGRGDCSAPMVAEFTVSESERSEAGSLVQALREVVQAHHNAPTPVVLAALAELGITYMAENKVVDSAGA